MSELPHMNVDARTPLVRRQLIRYFLGFSVIATLVGVLTPILGYIWPPRAGAQGSGGRVLIGSLIDIPAGSAKIFPLGTKPIIITHTKDDKVHAFSAVCTHLGCIVEWDESRQFILCPCHDARFNPTTGAVISGPAPSPLPTVEIVLDSQDIYTGGA
jgi:cytochrome b6-f complex iron-sulfur subunit